MDRLILIASGQAAVLLGGRIVARLTTGKFVGEIGFLSDEPATATVLATVPVRCLVWKKTSLEKTLAQRSELKNIFYAAVGQDLAAKVATHNVKLSEV